MEMSWPYALHSKFNPANDYTAIDYSMTSPLSADGSNFPCKGYQNDRPFAPVVTYVAGSTYNLTLAGTATHGGGSCQISLSYDNGATFRVIKSIIGGCPLASTYDFTIPSFVPEGDALLSWSWQNHAGNREMYQNCAQITIHPSTSQRRKRQSFKTLESLPFIWKANLEGVNGCATTERDDPVYPNPGPDVVYDDRHSASSVATSGTCDWPTPYGMTYKDLGDSTLPPDSDGSPTSESNRIANAEASDVNETPTIRPETIRATATSEAASRYSGTKSELLVRSASITAAPTLLDAPKKAVASDLRTVTVTADCETTITVTIPFGTPLPTMRTTTRTMPSSRQANTAATPTPQPTYATQEANAFYLPCVPGTFLCTSRTTFLTCNYNDGTVASDETWVYLASQERTVAAGMECLPMLAPHANSVPLQEQQGSTPVGQYRDDRYVAARPEGPCDVNGSLECTGNGRTFSVCDNGGWISMGPVAYGTVCSNGLIIASTT
ncbi:hypothetical protein CKM354_000297800 [Cercospora kikuchii]|uniref:Lytic polysaccharide monooxygenase n=1 Tax=Cercospora kikuchii TaxID=84275 RepID=A0A9P3FEB1_9PEZI|nr:uncharacterized protein CKM354_000297800 [Cercospora kikuchii]GIZ39599.1 hypothetical protein CKM354_000297800 [Cercospora kikuchii]